MRSTRDDSPEAYRERYERAPCGLLTTRDDGAIERVNGTLCAWLGYAADELVERRLQDLLTVGSKIFHHTHWIPLLHMQGSVAEVQVEFVHRDGHAIPMLVNAMQRAEGEALYHDLAVFIATDRRTYERELLAARRRAEELLASERRAQDALSRATEKLREQEQQAQARAVLAEQLIGIVSHDLRTPLSTVMLSASSLAAGGLTAVQARVVKRISTAASRANRLIADLLDFTQVQLGGGLRVRPRAIDLHALVAECVEELTLASPGRAVEHRRRGEGPAVADPDRVAQMVTNLAVNALTYGTPERPISVTSTVAERALEICVHNDGSPIPDALMPHLFEPMRRGEQHVSLGSRSVGLGLYIVKAIAGAHGGDVTVRSTRDAGTTFTVTLPMPAP